MVYGAQVNNLGYMVLSNRPGILTPVSLARLNSYALCSGIQNWGPQTSSVSITWEPVRKLFVHVLLF